MTAFLVLSITPLTITAIFFLQSHSKDLQEQSTSHLLSVRDTKQQQIIDYFEARETEVMGFVRSELLTPVVVDSTVSSMLLVV